MRNLQITLTILGSVAIGALAGCAVYSLGEYVRKAAQRKGARR